MKSLERNDQLLDSPEQIGDDPYGDGWLIKVKADDLDDLDDDIDDAQRNIRNRSKGCSPG